MVLRSGDYPLADRRQRASTASIAAAASRCIVGVTSEYVSRVIAIVECPSISETIFG